MSALAVFGICVAIVVAILVFALMLLGSGFFMIIAILPVVIAEAITGQRGSFSPTGTTRKAPFFEPVMVFFIVVQVLVLAGILFGFYCLVFGWPATAAVPATEAMLSPLSNLEIYRLQIVNIVLWGFAGFFILMMTFNMIRYRNMIRTMPPLAIFQHYLLPLVMYPLAFVFLAASRNFLTSYTPGDVGMGGAARACAVIYIIYLLYSSGQLVYSYRIIVNRTTAELGFQYWFSIGTSTLYKVLFFYFVFRMYSYF